MPDSLRDSATAEALEAIADVEFTGLDEFYADHATRADNGAHPFDHVAFYVVVAVRHHRAVQSEQQANDRREP